MNLTGSYRALRNNSKSAMLAAIEIYNKPQITYRNECFSILLVNAWELLIKAVLSKNKQKIFHPKKPNQTYKTYSLDYALDRVKPYLPEHIPFEPIAQNVTVLSDYRNNSIHFYNQQGFEVLIYGLAQTSIVNYRDLMLSIFNIDISNEMNIGLLPLSFGVQPDPIQFLQRSKENPPKSQVLANFINEISQITRDLEAKHLDTGRFLTVFKVNIQSIKKVSGADVIVGVQPTGDESTPIYIEKRIDPNISHPENQTSIMQKVGSEINGVRFGTYQFQAIVWKYNIRDKPHLCWHTGNGAMTRYSPEVITFIKKLSQADMETATRDYRTDLRHRKKTLSVN